MSFKMKVFFYVLLNLIFILWAIDLDAQQGTNPGSKSPKPVLGAHVGNGADAKTNPDPVQISSNAKLYAKKGPAAAPMLAERGIPIPSLENQIAALELKLAAVPPNKSDEYAGFTSNLERLILIKKNLIIIRNALQGFFME